VGLIRALDHLNRERATAVGLSQEYALARATRDDEISQRSLEPALSEAVARTSALFK